MSQWSRRTFNVGTGGWELVCAAIGVITLGLVIYASILMKKWRPAESCRTGLRPALLTRSLLGCGNSLCNEVPQGSVEVGLKYTK
ncbi:hypothetical protein NDI39_19035 [Microcoleus sp. ZQ-A2]|nr:hypothetical protein [Microcoleus sp. FACHB-1]